MMGPSSAGSTGSERSQDEGAELARGAGREDPCKERQQGQDRVPGQHEPRSSPLPPERHQRLLRESVMTRRPATRGGRRYAEYGARHPALVGRAPAVGDQRHPRHVEVKGDKMTMRFQMLDLHPTIRRRRVRLVRGRRRRAEPAPCRWTWTTCRRSRAKPRPQKQVLLNLLSNAIKFTPAAAPVPSVWGRAGGAGRTGDRPGAGQRPGFAGIGLLARGPGAPGQPFRAGRGPAFQDPTGHGPGPLLFSKALIGLHGGALEIDPAT